MPVEVSVRLVREGAVYLVGEAVECLITVQNKKIGNVTIKDSLAWCSVQLHCQEVLNNRKVKVTGERDHRMSQQQQVGVGGTSFLPARGENGCTVYSSKPTVLFCDLELLPDEVKTFRYSEILPEEDIPPSFKGQAVKYLYKLTVGIQHVNAPVKLLRVPLRVLRILTTTGLSHLCMEEEGLSPSNPFLHGQQQRASTLDIANQIIENITTVRNCHIYNVTNAAGSVAQFALFKNGFKLGEDVIGRFSFEDCQVPCVQYCVSLQSQEELAEEYRLKNDQKSAITTHASHHAMCLFVAHSEVKLPIPLIATPTFFTDIVHLKWRLHFEFVTSKTDLKRPIDQNGTWQAPKEMDIETMVWDLPLKVFPCNPLNACLSTMDTEPMSLLTAG